MKYTWRHPSKNMEVEPVSIELGLFALWEETLSVSMHFALSQKSSLEKIESLSMFFFPSCTCWIKGPAWAVCKLHTEHKGALSSDVMVETACKIQRELSLNEHMASKPFNLTHWSPVSAAISCFTSSHLWLNMPLSKQGKFLNSNWWN